jgi:uncharacterized protein with HEPN domain
MRPEDRDKAYLWDMLQAARDILEFTRTQDLLAFTRDRRTRFAVERQLLVVGEAASHISESFKTKHPEIPWAGIIGQRNVLAHDYGEILVERIWLVSQRNIPPLAKQLSELLPDAPTTEPK